MDGNRNDVKVPFFALWKNTAKSGRVYYTGRLGDARVIAFENDKRGNEKAPDLRIYLVPDDKRQQQRNGGGGGFDSSDEESPF